MITNVFTVFFDSVWHLFTSIKVPGFNYTFATFYIAIAFFLLLIYILRMLMGTSSTFSSIVGSGVSSKVGSAMREKDARLRSQARSNKHK